MCSQLSPKVPGINQFLAMTTAEILELPVNKCPPSELYKLVYGIEHRINHPVTNQILALKYFGNRFNNSPERVELYDTVVPKLKESLCELLQSSQLDTICSLINSVTLAICDTVDSTCDDSSEALQSLAIGVLDLLLQLYKLIVERCHNAIESQRLNSITRCVNLIRAKLFEHFKSNEANYLPDNFTVNDATFVNRVIFLLCELAEFAFKAEDATHLVAVWRCIVTICNFPKLPKSIDRLPMNDDEPNYFEFLLTVVKTGCCCIQRGWDNMLESSSELTAKFHNKTITFITNVIQRLATVYSHCKFRGQHHILTTLLTMMRTIRVHSQPNPFLNQDLVSGLQNVLLSICKSDEFVESYRRIASEEFSIDLLHIGLELSKKLLDDPDSDFLRYFVKSEYVNVIDKMVQCMSTDPTSMFSESHVYQQTIETLSCILIKCSAPTSTLNPNIVPRLLVKNLLQSNTISSGYIWMDLWSAWIGCLSEEQCYNLILFWSEISTKCSVVQTNHLTSVHVKILLRNLYDGLTGSYRRKLSADKRISNNKFWATLGLRRRECEANDTTNVHMKIDELLKTLLIDRTDAGFYKLIEHLRLLETIPQSNTAPVPDYLIQLWHLNLNHRPKEYSTLIAPLIRVSITYLRSLSNSQHLQILRKLSSIVNSPSVPIRIQLEALRYLRRVAIIYFTVEHQKDILLAIRQLFNKGFVNADPLVRKAAFTAYVKVISEAKHDDIHPDNMIDDANVKTELFDFMRSHKNSKRSGADQQIKFLRELSACSIQHECAGVSLQRDNETSADFHSDEIGIKEIIDRMRDDAAELIALNRRIRLTDEFCKRIASIRKELASLE